MLPGWSYNTYRSMEDVKVSNSARCISGKEKITNIHTWMWRCHIGKCYGAAPRARRIVFPGQACPPWSVMLMFLYYFLWRPLALSLMLLFPPLSKCYLSVGVAGLIEACLLPFSLWRVGWGETKPGERGNLSQRQKEGGIHTEPAPPSTWHNPITASLICPGVTSRSQRNG